MNETEKAIEVLQWIKETFVAIKANPENIAAIEFAIQAVCDKYKIKCENCAWLEKESFFADDDVPMSEQTYYTCVVYGDDVPEGTPVKSNHFCGFFKQKSGG